VETNAAATAATLKPAGLPGAQPSSRTVCNESLQAPTLLYFALYFFYVTNYSFNYFDFFVFKPLTLTSIFLL